MLHERFVPETATPINFDCSPSQSAELSTKEGIRTKLFGLSLLCASRRKAAAEIIGRATQNHQSTINFVNAHCVNIAASDSDYRACLEQSDMLLPDGSGMAIAAKLAGAQLGENLNGTDLFPVLCQMAAQSGLSIYLHGGEPEIAARAARAMQKRYPDLIIAGVSNGFEDHVDAQSVVRKINTSEADLVFIGLGVPKQEKWIAEHRKQINAPVVLGVGGLFDYYSGRIPRAPQLLRSAGLEWTWRLMQEPQRLANRYLVGNVRFLARAAAHAYEVRDIGRRIFVTNKRTLDLTLTLLGLLLIGPLFAAIALLIMAEDRGPVFFKQTRIGENGRPFQMWKFRSMAVDAEQRLQSLIQKSDRNGAAFKMKDDPRITTIGKIIRRFSMDELPQLINVMRGEMSLVGPRPALPGEVMQKPNKSMNRLAGKPGLTCTWQVSGRAEIPFEQQVQMDEEYLKEQTVRKDIGLLLSTIPAVLTGHGAY